MPDIEDAVTFALAQAGKPYKAYGDRFGMSYFDCSGLVIRSLSEAGVPLPNGISVERKWGNTVSPYTWAKDVGGLVSVDKAIRTRGALLIKGKWYGNGPLGHVSFSLGDGQQMAARGRRSGIGVSNVRAGFYQDGFIIPDVFYRDLEPVVDPAILEAIKRLIEWGIRVTAGPLRLGDTNNDVAILNRLLFERGLLASTDRMNTYTKYTRDAVVHFKKLAHLSNTIGHTFGGEAVAAILKPR